MTPAFEKKVVRSPRNTRKKWCIFGREWKSGSLKWDIEETALQKASLRLLLAHITENCWGFFYLFCLLYHVFFQTLDVCSHGSYIYFWISAANNLLDYQTELNHLGDKNRKFSFLPVLNFYLSGLHVIIITVVHFCPWFCLLGF